MTMKAITLLLLICFSLSTVAFAERKFSRYKGRALQFGISLYQGVPPEKYVYKSLGNVRGEYKSGFFDSAVYTISNALEDLANKAKEIGANAVIKIEPRKEGNTFIYEGEAVVFETLPSED